ncbi:MAG: DUF3048 domain-containing protein [Anaerolineaceae bacterium]|nr:DUF3048 domain-containing protein [Anaerolineaceae bacterium]
MRCSVRSIGRFIGVVAAVVLVAAVAGCGSSRPLPPTPTSELAVVVFATEAPPAAVTPTPFVPADTPTPAPTVATAPTANPAVFDRSANVNPLTGLPVSDPAILQRRPLMVRVGNDPEARPQVALNAADVVYEELVEWWVTRFSAIFLTNDPDTIAPIRSARLINQQLTVQYDAALVNSGGSDEVRWELSQTDIVNLDEFYVPGPYFYRPNEGWQTRLAFNATLGREYLDREGLDGNVNLRGFSFSDALDATTFPADVVSDATSVTIPYPSQTSEARWEYDAASGRYLRFTTDEPHMDFNGDQLSAANVVIYFADHQDTDIVEDSAGATSIRIIVNGFGPAWLVRDGKLLKGNWETGGRETPRFIFGDGRPMPFKPGNTWIEVVPLDYAIEINGATQEFEGQVPADSPTGETDSETAPAIAPTLTPIGARAQPGN